MENKDVFMAAYARAEEKNNLQHSVLTPVGGPRAILMSPASDIIGEGIRRKTVRTAKRTAKKLDKKARKLGKKVMKTGQRALDTVEKAGEWYRKE